MNRLDRILEKQQGVIVGMARRYARLSWGARALDFDDYLQEARLVAVKVYRRHARRVTDEALCMMISKGVLFRLRKVWALELKRCSRFTDLSESHLGRLIAEDIGYGLFFHYVLDEAMNLLTGIQREMFEILTTPERDPVTLGLCFELFRPWPNKPIQRAEFVYLAHYFNLSYREVEEHFVTMRAQVLPLLEKVA